MTMWLKQSTAATVKLGPFVDSADGNTVEGSLTISQADIRLSKNGGDIAQTNNATGATHDELGYYDVPLDTTDTNTLGRLKVMVHESGALPVWADYMVVPANVWDAMFGADKLQVDAVEINSVAAAAVSLALSAGTMVAGNAITGTLSTTQFTTDLTSAVNDFYNGRIVIFTSGSLAGQAREITDYVGSTKLVTVATLTAAPSNGDDFIII